MDISPLLKCGLKLRQIVDKKTRKNSIIDVLIMNLASYYKSPIIASPIDPDNPLKAEPSDHSVPVCYPHLSRHDRPLRNRKIIKFRPLPESNIIQFGQWIVNESWSGIDKSQSTSQQAHSLEHTLKSKVESIFPLKTKRLSSHDKPFITSEIKKIDRQRSREYVKNGKSLKYMRLKKLFNEKYRAASEKYLETSIKSLETSKVGQAFRVLKTLGAQPGESVDSCSFVLPAHENENLSAQQSAERIAVHFSAISQEFPPLNIDLLDSNVKNKLENPG